MGGLFPLGPGPFPQGQGAGGQACLLGLLGTWVGHTGHVTSQRMSTALGEEAQEDLDTRQLGTRQDGAGAATGSLAKGRGIRWGYRCPSNPFPPFTLFPCCPFPF